jgi:hypothetical protein
VAYVRADAYKLALLEAEKNTCQTRDADGNVVLITEKNAAGNTIIVRGDVSSLIECLLLNTESALFSDHAYTDDFLLTFRVFKSPYELLQLLYTTMKTREKLCDRLIEIVVRWHRHFLQYDVEADPRMQALLGMVEAECERKLIFNKDVGQLLRNLQLMRALIQAGAVERVVTVSRANSEQSYGISLRGGQERGQDIFVANVQLHSPAHVAGVCPGDQLLVINGQKCDGLLYAAVCKAVAASDTLNLTVKYNHSGFKAVSDQQSGQQRPRPSEEDAALSDLPLDSMRKRSRSLTAFERRKISRDKERPSGSGKTLGMNLVKMIFRPKENSEGVAMTDLERWQMDFDPDVHQVIKVYRADQSHRYVAITPQTTAREVCDLLCIIWGLPDPENHSLCEVSVVNSVFLKQTTLRDPTDNLAANFNVNGRYYLKSASKVESLVPDDAKDEIVTVTKESYMTEATGMDIARAITEQDFTMFTDIKLLEYLAFLFEGEVGTSRTAALQAFTRRFNFLVAWVSTEICKQKSLRRRVDQIKVFINIARSCHDFQNFNAMFAIISGLGSPPVARLKQSWERLPAKYAALYREMERLMDPSRNMACYRSLHGRALEKLPMVPFFPLVMKDLAFVHEG